MTDAEHRDMGRAGLLVAIFAGLACGDGRTAAPELARAGAAALEPSVPAEPAALVARVYFTDFEDRDRLAVELDSLEQADPFEKWIGALLTPEEHARLLAEGRRVEIDLARTERVNQPRPEGVPGQTTIPGYSCYRTVEETANAMSAIATQRPDLARWVDVGDSWDKTRSRGLRGYDLNVLVLTNRSIPGPKPKLFLMGAIHAREYTTAEIVARFAEYLVNGYGVDPDITWMLDHFEAHLLAHSNPDGRKTAEQGYYQRKNNNNTVGSCSNPPTMYDQYGVDLNRNSTVKWGGSGSSTDPCAQTYRGTAAGSEPETRAIEAYLRSIFPDQRGPGDNDPAPLTASGVMITLHSYARQVLFPWGATSTPAPNMAGLQTLGRKFGFHNGYDVCQPTICLYSSTGTTDDFAYGDLGVASYTFEVGNDFFEPCSSFESEVYPNNLQALRYALKAARRPYLDPGAPEVVSVTVTPSTLIAGQSAALTAQADDTRSNSNGWGAEPIQNVSGLRYTVGSPSWAGVSAVTMGPADGAFNTPVERGTATVSTAGWAPGRRLLFVEARDGTANWGAPTAAFLDVQPRVVALQLSPATSTQDGQFGTTVTHSLTVTNSGNLPDTFMVLVSESAWPWSAPSSVGPLAPGASASVPVRISIPAGAPLGAVASTWVSAISRADTSKGRSAQLLTRAIGDDVQPPTVALAPPGDKLSGAVTLQATASDDVQVARVELLQDGAVIGTASAPPYTFTWDTTQVSDGVYWLSARAFDARGNVGETGLVQVSVANRGPCSVAQQLIVNGGFEAGGDGWAVSGVNVIDDDPATPPHSGLREASLVGYGFTSSESVSQTVIIPAGACSAWLSFYVQVETMMLGTYTGDLLEVVVTDAATGAETVLATVAPSEGKLVYAPRRLDLAAFRGRQVTVTLRGSEDKEGATLFLVDDVALDVEVP